MKTAKISTTPNPGRWQAALISLGIASMLVAIVLECMAIFWKVTTTTTTMDPKGSMSVTVDHTTPDAAIITGLFTLGAALILAGAFYSRLTKITIDGIEFDFNTQDKLTNAIKAKTEDSPDHSPARKQRMYVYALERYTSTRTVSGSSHTAALVAPPLEDDDIDELVNEAFESTAG